MAYEWLKRIFSPFSSSPHAFWQARYSRPVVDLGDRGGEPLRGIFSPTYDEATIARYIHGQFRAQAQDYARKYAAVEYFYSLLSDALTKIGWEVPCRARLAILDIGSGAGNSIFPLLHLCPASFVLASDLSVELLLLLKTALMEQGLSHRVALLQLNAEELDFAAESFDVVVGAAVLHHLLSPDKTLLGCARILKRGGCAIFFEPFENGNAILGLIYNAILQQARAETLASDVRGFLQSLATDSAVRKGREKSLPIFQHCEDKWLFTKSYFEETASRARFSHCTIYPLHVTERQFEKQLEVNLRLGLGKTREALPHWAWEIVQYYDNFFSTDLKNDLLIEGGIILQK
jgi:ubiquinone/menaquinone biosynthesis C-methylase UbiE